MTRRILIIDGHPDASDAHFIHELARYALQGTEERGHRARLIRVGSLTFPLLRNGKEYMSGKVPAGILAAQKSIKWADHLIILYPLWLGSMPAVSKGFLEQVFRPGFAFPRRPTQGARKYLLKGRSARVVVTTATPGLFSGQIRVASNYRSVARDVLESCGIRPVRTTMFGNVDRMTAAQCDKAFYTMRVLGAEGK